MPRPAACTSPRPRSASASRLSRNSWAGFSWCGPSRRGPPRRGQRWCDWHGRPLSWSTMRSRCWVPIPTRRRASPCPSPSTPTRSRPGSSGPWRGFHSSIPSSSNCTGTIRTSQRGSSSRAPSWVRSPRGRRRSPDAASACSERCGTRRSRLPCSPPTGSGTASMSDPWPPPRSWTSTAATTCRPSGSGRAAPTRRCRHGTTCPRRTISRRPSGWGSAGRCCRGSSPRRLWTGANSWRSAVRPSMCRCTGSSGTSLRAARRRRRRDRRRGPQSARRRLTSLPPSSTCPICTRHAGATRTYTTSRSARRAGQDGGEGSGGRHAARGTRRARPEARQSSLTRSTILPRVWPFSSSAWASAASRRSNTLSM
jgi:hypothetical protein